VRDGIQREAPGLAGGGVAQTIGDEAVRRLVARDGRNDDQDDSSDDDGVQNSPPVPQRWPSSTEMPISTVAYAPQKEKHQAHQS
jgi:hypothetical protein